MRNTIAGVALACVLLVTVSRGAAGEEASGSGEEGCLRKVDGLGCSDGDGSTDRDVCMSGVCDQCHLEDLEGNCVSSCLEPFVKDVQTPVSLCVPLHPECSEHCIECDETGSYCVRCFPPKMLELDHSCTAECADGELPKIVFTPKTNYECMGERVPPTATTEPPLGPGDTTTEAAATTEEIDLDQPCPEDYDCDVKYNRCCRVTTSTTTTTTTPPSTAAITTTPSTTLSADSSRAGSELGVILAFSISAGVLLLLVLVYFGRQKMMTGKCRGEEGDATHAPYGDAVEMGSMNHAVAAAAPTGPTIISIGGMENTSAEDTDDAPAPAAPASLSGVVAAEFLDALSKLKKDRNKIAMLLEGMQKRQEQKRTVDGKQKYDTIINDLSRMLAMLREKKQGNIVPPADGNELIAWTTNMLEQFQAKSGSA